MQKRIVTFFADFGLLSGVVSTIIRKPFEKKSATSAVARVRNVIVFFFRTVDFSGYVPIPYHRVRSSGCIFSLLQISIYLPLVEG